MKTFYAAIISFLFVFTASAQTPVTIVSETFQGATNKFTYSSTPNAADQWEAITETSGAKYLSTVTYSNTATKVLQLTNSFSTVGHSTVWVSWEESRVVKANFTAAPVKVFYSFDGTNYSQATNNTFSADTWKQIDVEIPAAAGKSTVFLKFEVTTSTGNGKTGNNSNLDYFAIDNFIVSNQRISAASLPVELASFKGQTVNKAAKLAWTTATEKNNDKFVVERSQDGKSFSSVGEVKGSGNSAIKRSYSYTDNAPAAGVNYYRLRQVDTDGTEYFSSVVALEVAAAGIEASVYPTIASKAVTISLQNLTGNASVSVVDATGRPVATFTNTTAREIELPVQNLKSGMYFVRVTNGQNQQVQRFIKE